MQISEKQIILSIDELKENIPEKKTKTKQNISRKDLEELQKYLQSLPEVRKEKVTILNKSISNKKYDITPEKIAEKLLGRIISDHIT